MCERTKNEIRTIESRAAQLYARALNLAPCDVRRRRIESELAMLYARQQSLAAVIERGETIPVNG